MFLLSFSLQSPIGLIPTTDLQEAIDFVKSNFEFIGEFVIVENNLHAYSGAYSLKAADIKVLSENIRKMWAVVDDDGMIRFCIQGGEEEVFSYMSKYVSNFAVKVGSGYISTSYVTKYYYYCDMHSSELTALRIPVFKL